MIQAKAFILLSETRLLKIKSRLSQALNNALANLFLEPMICEVNLSTPNSIEINAYLFNVKNVPYVAIDFDPNDFISKLLGGAKVSTSESKALLQYSLQQLANIFPAAELSGINKKTFKSKASYGHPLILVSCIINDCLVKLYLTSKAVELFLDVNISPSSDELSPIKTALMQQQITLAAYLKPDQIRASMLEQLKVGQIIKLNSHKDDKLDIRSCDKKLFSAKLRAMNKNKALQV